MFVLVSYADILSWTPAKCSLCGLALSIWYHSKSGTTISFVTLTLMQQDVQFAGCTNGCFLLMSDSCCWPVLYKVQQKLNKMDNLYFRSLWTSNFQVPIRSISTSNNLLLITLSLCLLHTLLPNIFNSMSPAVSYSALKEQTDLCYLFLINAI